MGISFLTMADTFLKHWYRTLALLSIGIVAVPASSRNDHETNQEHWVGAWACSPQLAEPENRPPAPGLSDATLRQIVHVSVGGERLRVRLSNAFGSRPLSIAAVHIAPSLGGSKISVESDEAVTFNGTPSVTIPAGALAVSDPVALSIAPLSNLAITMHVETTMTEITAHPGSRQTSYLQSGDSVSAAELPGATEMAHWYFINGLDVSSSPSSASIVAFGDSITDGHGSTTGGNDRWPDDLARRLRASRKTASLGVLNEGIGGNRLLHDGTGPNALARFDRDVLAQTGVRWLIVLEGINDIGTEPDAGTRHEQPATADQLIAAFEQMIVRAHAHGIRIYGATILPDEGAGYFTSAGEADRQKVNTWIRTSGKFDAVIDFDAVTRDPRQPSRLSAAADCGDHLHPSPAGYKTMADAIDLKLFETR